MLEFSQSKLSQEQADILRIARSNLPEPRWAKKYKKDGRMDAPMTKLLQEFDILLEKAQKGEDVPIGRICKLVDRYTKTDLLDKFYFGKEIPEILNLVKSTRIKLLAVSEVPQLSQVSKGNEISQGNETLPSMEVA